MKGDKALMDGLPDNIAATNRKTPKNGPPKHKNPHAGHRERLKQRFRQEGLDSFAPHNVLELLLFFAVPQRDTNPIGHALIERFGSLAAAMDASFEDLLTVPGLGENAATLLKLIPDISRVYELSRSDRDVKLDTLEKTGSFLLPHFIGRRHEVVFLLCLDASAHPLCCKQINEGSVNAAQISIRRVVETALSHNAVTVVLAHNHLSGLALPSPEDEHTTRQLRTALSSVGISLLDHIIVADGDYVSMAQSGMLLRR